jgi:hypothetical protein
MLLCIHASQSRSLRFSTDLIQQTGKIETLPDFRVQLGQCQALVNATALSLGPFVALAR